SAGRGPAAWSRPPRRPRRRSWPRIRRRPDAWPRPSARGCRCSGLESYHGSRETSARCLAYTTQYCIVVIHGKRNGCDSVTLVIQRPKKGEPMSDLPQRLRRLLTAAAALESAAPPEDDSQHHGVGARLRDSVLRPLRQIHGATPNGDESAMDGPERSGSSAGGDVEARNSAQHF